MVEWWNDPERTTAERLQLVGIVVGVIGIALTAWRVLR